VLREAHPLTDARLLVGPQTLDDAGVVVLGPGEGLPADCRLGLVQTLDFFPPVVDDPWWYGAIAAANALSDVYAMGGVPVSALTVASFPKGFDRAWMTEILRGGFEKVRESGAVVAGGHTVEGELLFGFSVTGWIDPARVVSNSGARAGDVLYLTKSLGMGSLTTGAKQGAIGWAEVEPAARQMATLNAAGAAAMNAVGAHACTDITGYGLIGHAANVARASETTLRFRASDVPVFDGALELARRGVMSGGSKRGRSTLGSEVELGADVEEALASLCFDAETSGGLLIAVARDRSDDLETELRAREVPVHAVGEVIAPTGMLVELV
jgi:selenide,water dikinase